MRSRPRNCPGTRFGVMSRISRKLERLSGGKEKFPIKILKIMKCYFMNFYSRIYEKIFEKYLVWIY